MPGTRIGNNVIIAAGAKVSGSIPAHSVLAPSPAVVICKTEELLARMKEASDEYPWSGVVAAREGPFDAGMQPLLDELRRKHWSETGQLPARH
jgi:hypothetical protein